MEEELKDPLDVSAEPELIKEAQAELKKVDVLVCGGCHQVYHFIEEFQNHKSADECPGISVLKNEDEDKPQIWGFTLWKSKQIKSWKDSDEPMPTSWEIYQRWTKVDQLEKDSWISAGRTLQFCNEISTATVKEKTENKIEKDPLALDDDFKQPMDNGVAPSDTEKSEVVKVPKTAVRSSEAEREEYNVEKIVGKRFNPKRRYFEYEVKWENYKDLTWEPITHLENCKVLVQEFEDKLKAEKEKDKPSRGRGRPRLNPLGTTPVKPIVKKTPPVTPVIINTDSGGRPQRSSKQKALNQVKAWCGNISDDESGVKRPYDDDDDSDDSLEKKIKLGADSEDTEEDEPKPPVKKIAKIVHTYNNGMGKKLPANVLIPDAKGVVRISQKQLPSLSSGVYIMSKSSGIIKLDPTASRIATSGGQAIVKVSPKIGQTQIKIIKKDDGNRRSLPVKSAVESSTPTTPKTTPVRPLPPIAKPSVSSSTKKEAEKIIRKAIGSSPRPFTAKVIVKEKDQPAKVAKFDDESDDGLEELEFPTDLPLPEPDSPPGEFVLDPFTGKIAGQEYPDPEPEPVINDEKKQPIETIDNIVKLAAADITEDDLKMDVVEPATTSNSIMTITTTSVQEEITPAPAAPVKEDTVLTVVSKPKQSILNAAIANSNILQKTLMTPTPPRQRQRPQPKIINQSIAQKPRPTVSPIIRNVTPKSNLIRKPSVLPKPKFHIAPMAPQTVRNVYSNTNNTPKKIGYTTIQRTPKSTPSIVRKNTASKLAATTPTTTVSPPKAVISMPSLDEDAPAVATSKVEPAAASSAEADLSSLLACGDRPMFITGDDGTVYQVAGQNEEGQTILVTQDSNGQQQCLLVTSEALQEETPQAEEAPAEVMMEVPEQVDMAEEQPVVAQFIRTEPLSPGGTHKVVVMLPDGDVMVTQVTPEEYANLELDQ